MSEQLQQLAELIKQRNQIAEQIASLIGRPTLIGHIGEYIAKEIFDIVLYDSAVTKAIDGQFKSGPLKSKTVNIKFYGKQEGLLDLSRDSGPNYYLVLTGPKSPAASSRGTTRPWSIEAVYLFEHNHIVGELRRRGLKIGVASSVRQQYWRAAQIYPYQNNKRGVS